MRGKFIIAIAALGLVLLMPASLARAAVDQSPGATDISGVVTHNGNPVNNANVTATCNSISESDSTDYTGTYIVIFTSSECYSGLTVNVTASSGNLNGSNSGTVDGLTARLNVAVVNVSFVPELGTVTGIAAVTLGGGAFLVIRRHNSGENTK